MILLYLYILLQLIVSPIRTRSKGTRKSNVVLGAYECHQVFMNVEEIHQTNTDFCNDLHKYSKQYSNRSFIGRLFSRHVSTYKQGMHTRILKVVTNLLFFFFQLDKFKCYRNFLLGVENARHFHTKELKHNVSYQAFIDVSSIQKHDRKNRSHLSLLIFLYILVQRVTDDGNSTVYGYLLLPAERIGHYRVFLQGKQHFFFILFFLFLRQTYTHYLHIYNQKLSSTLLSRILTLATSRKHWSSLKKLLASMTTITPTLSIYSRVCYNLSRTVR